MVLVLDNYDSFTWNLVQRLGAVDCTLRLDDTLRVVRNDAMTVMEAVSLLEGASDPRLIISPGPCTPAESGISRGLIAAMAGRVPILGVCLGHQCMADVFGMRVQRHSRTIHGKTTPLTHDGRGLFQGVPQGLSVARYHSLVVDAGTVPRGWTITATTQDPAREGEAARDGAPVVMGLRREWDEAPLEGVQFHPESFMTEQGDALLANFLTL